MFTGDAIHKCGEASLGFPREVFLGVQNQENYTTKMMGSSKPNSESLKHDELFRILIFHNYIIETKHYTDECLFTIFCEWCFLVLLYELYIPSLYYFLL
jgi:hypothetical protein